MVGIRKKMRVATAALAAGALLLSACGGDDGGGETAAGGDVDATEATGGGTPDTSGGTTDASCEGAAGETIEISVSPSGLPVYVAGQEGLFEGLDIEVSQVGYDQSAALFLAGDTPVGWIAPIEVAEFVSQGEEFQYFSTAGATNMINGLVIRAEDSDKYQSVEDLVGQRVGNPGFGTGTWATFEVIMQSQYGIDPQNDFDNLTADSGALLGLLETGEIEAALLFSGQSAAAIALDQFETIFSFTDAWQESTGQPMVVNGPVARASWLEENTCVASVLVDGIDAAVQWMKDNPQEFREDGKYAEWIEAEGWLSSPETTEGIHELLQDGEWYLTSDAYTEDWVDSIYSLVEAGEGTLVESVPPKDDIFFPPSQLAEAGS
jgi:ABC-type nitrate/sulfonate/bicarbonate transport system substrate-binding protein